MLDEFFNFTTPLADQADDDNVGLGEARHHAQQHRFTDTGTSEQTQTLAAPDRQQTVDATDTDVQRLADRVTVERVDRRAVHRHPVFGLHAALAVQRAAGAVKHTTEHAHAHRQTTGFGQRHHAGPRSNPGNTADRHQKDFAAGKAHDLRFDLRGVIAVIVDHQAACAHGRAQAFGFEREADHAQQAPFENRRAGHLGGLGVGAQALGEAGAFKAHRGGPRAALLQQPSA